MTCKTLTQTVTVKGKKRKVQRQRCTTRLITGTTTFTTAAARATVVRGRVIYAAGTAGRTGSRSTRGAASARAATR